VGNQHYGVSLLVQLLQKPQHLAASMGVQRAGGLVRQNDRRVAHQCPRNGHALLLAAGKLVGAVFQLVAKPHLFQHLPGADVAVGAGDARIHQRHLHIFHQVQLGQQIVLLEDKAQHLVADSGQLVAVHLAHIPAIEPVGAVGRHIQTADDVHAGGFARAGLAHDGHELAFFDFHSDVVGSLYRGIAHLVIFADLIKLDQSAHSSLLRQSTTTAPASAGSMPSAGSSASAAGASPFSVSSGSVSSPPSARSALFPASSSSPPPISS